jgi:hypothetical protein
MLIRRVRAHAFGPMAGDELEFADGLTVIYGENESAKSSWHAAVYAALCGRRRGRGGPTAEERRFAELHRPWDGTAWVVSAEVLLDDGRRVELRQDLDGRVDCHAKDLDLGRDCSAQIMNDGTPDAAKWLGLDRTSFAATACVGQAQVLRVMDEADGLQEHLQRAAATAGADHTAAAALERIAAFQRDHVGIDRAGSGKPLRRAGDRLRVAHDRLATARKLRLEYETRVLEVQRLRAVETAADRTVRLQEAAAAVAAYEVIGPRADEATELHRQLGGVEPASVAEAEAVTRAVVRALTAWGSRPSEPVDPSPVELPDVSDVDLLDLARSLDRPVPGADEAAEAKVLQLRGALLAARTARARRAWLGVGGVLMAGGGATLAAMREPYVSAGLFLAAAVLLILALVSRRPGGVAAARAQLAEAALEAATARRATESAAAEREQVLARCTQLGVPADASALREMARQHAESKVRDGHDRRWGTEIREVTARAEQQVLDAATLCGFTASDVDEAVAQLQTWQQSRAAELAGLDERRREWTRLQRLSDGRSVAELREEATKARERATRAGLAFEAVDLATVSRADDDHLRALRRQAQVAAAEAAAAQGSLTEWAANLASVSEAEEELEHATAELGRVRDLDDALELTRRFLAAAQERVHRDIAPALAQTLKRMLPVVTGNRYTDVTVDPLTLRVDVCDSTRRWRIADRLSFGTAEQVYLLLRIALAGHLVKPGVTCPLLLDDVTVHADRVRVIEILDLLLAASQHQQVILFTQQEQVREWARAHLDGPRHVLRELAPVPTV